MTDTYLKIFTVDGDINTALKCLRKCKDPEIFFPLCEYFLSIFENNLDILTILAEFCFENNRKDTCFESCCNILNRVSNFYTINQEKILKLKNSCFDSIKDKYTFYNVDIVENILKRPKKPFDIVTLSITTCKRLQLFKDTINSFLNCCQDIDKIDRWILIDDNSSEEDRKYIKINYPFFETIFKDKNNKGHPQSMNIILDTVKSPYLFHMEDDWKFFEKRRYITDCINVISQNQNYGQCLINKNYSELFTDDIAGGFLHTCTDGTKYIVHEHCENNQQYELFNKKYNNKANCAYWPHFSFRPSLIKTNVFKILGKFNENVSHFEREYSNRYFKNGFISTFLDGIFCMHTGRLTSEINDETKINAYILNNEKQFTGKENSFKIFVINLDRRKDRWDNISKMLDDNIIRFPAVDGLRLKNSEQLQRIFDNNDYNMRRGMVGCALSHIKLYIDLYNSTEDQVYCILEDDITVSPDFKNKLNYLYSKLPKDWDFCYLGCHLWKQYQTLEFLNHTELPLPEKWDKKKSFTYSIGGTSGYLINKSGAKKLLDYINITGMTNCIDTMQQNCADDMNLYYSKPHIVFSDCWTLNNNTDTDIQGDITSLTMSIQKRLELEIKKYSKPIFTNNYDFTEKYITDKSKISTLFFSGSNQEVEKLLTKCIFKYYRMGKEILVVVPTENIVYEKRLWKNGEYNIDDALKYKNIISLETFENFDIEKIVFSESKSFDNITLKQVENPTFIVCTKYQKINIHVLYNIIDHYLKSGTDIEILCVNAIKDIVVEDKYKKYLINIEVEYKNIDSPFGRISYEYNYFIPTIKDKLKNYL